MTTNSYNTYIKNIAYYVVFIMMFVILINFTVDPGNIYPKLSIQKDNVTLKTHIEELLGSEYGVFMPSGINERSIKKALAEYPINYDCAVIGSSHVMQISAVRKHNSLQDICLSMKNLGVSGGSLEDYLALSNIILNNTKYLPKTIVFGVDPWSLKLNQESKWVEYEQDYLDMRKELLQSISSSNLASKSLILNLINLQYFKRSLIALFTDSVSSTSTPVPKFDYSNGLIRAVTLPDGSLVYSSENIENNKESIKKISGKHNYKIVKDKFYHPHAVELFQKLITHLKTKGIDVVLVLTPYHHKVWSIKSQPIIGVMKAVEKRVHDLAESLEIQVIGSYNPNIVGCLPDEFYDAMHAKSECFEKLDRFYKKH